MPEAAVVSDASVTAPEVADVVPEEAEVPDALDEAFVSLVVSTVAAAVPVGPSVT